MFAFYCLSACFNQVEVVELLRRLDALAGAWHRQPWWALLAQATRPWSCRGRDHVDVSCVLAGCGRTVNTGALLSVHSFIRFS